MKKINRLLAIFSIAALTFIAACDTEDPDKDENVREKYTGAWTCTETGGMSYPVTVSEDPSNSAQVLIANFHYFGNAYKAIAVVTTNNITIQSQELCGNTIAGSGNLTSANRIEITYTVNDHTDIRTVNAVYAR